MNVSIYLNFWKYTESLSVKTSFFCCTMKGKRWSLQRLIKANLSLHKLPSLDWNKTQRVSEGISKQMNEAAYFLQIKQCDCCGTGDKGLAQPLSSLLEISISERKRLNAAPALPTQNERLTQFHYVQHQDEMALTTVTPPKRVPSPLPSCHHYRGQGTSKVT